MAVQVSPFRCCDNFKPKDLERAVPICAFFSMEPLQNSVYSITRPCCKGTPIPTDTPSFTAWKGCLSHSNLAYARALLENNNHVLTVAHERVLALNERLMEHHMSVYNHGQFEALIKSTLEENTWWINALLKGTDSTAIANIRRVCKPGFECITRRELAYKDFTDDGTESFTSLEIPIEVGDILVIYRDKVQKGKPAGSQA